MFYHASFLPWTGKPSYLIGRLDPSRQIACTPLSPHPRLHGQTRICRSLIVRWHSEDHRSTISILCALCIYTAFFHARGVRGKTCTRATSPQFTQHSFSFYFPPGFVTDIIHISTLHTAISSLVSYIPNYLPPPLPHSAHPVSNLVSIGIDSLHWSPGNRHFFGLSFFTLMSVQVWKSSDIPSHTFPESPFLTCMCCTLRTFCM